MSIKVGLIGCGRVADIHINSFKKISDVSVAVICDVNETLGKKKAEELGAKYYKDYKDIIRNEKLDGMDICTPPFFHRDIAVDFLSAGVNVICEKPLSVSVKDAEDMIEAANKNKKILMTAFRHRFISWASEAKKFIEEGRLGKILMFRNRFAGSSQREGGWFADKKIAGGGCLTDTSAHSIDLFHYFVGDIKSVMACASTVIQKIETEENGIIIVEGINKELGVIEASWSSPHSQNIIEIYGDKGSIVMDYVKEIAVFKLDNEELTIKPKDIWTENFYLELDNFVKAIKGEEQPMVTGLDGLKAVRVTEAVYESINKRKKILIN